MKEYYPNFPNQGDNSFLPNFTPLNENEQQLLLQDLIGHADESLAEQPVFNPDYFNVSQNNDQSMYPQQNQVVQYASTLNTPVYEAADSVKWDSETGSPLSYTEEKVNLNEIKHEQNLGCLTANPLYVLSVVPWSGPYNFRVTIPAPNLQGVKPKWCFSECLNKLYVARNVAFPVNVTLDNYPLGAVLSLCPVFTKSSNRMIPVTRCPNCLMADKSIESRDHVIKVEGSSPYYFYQNDRHMVSIPLGQPAPGDNMLNAFFKVCCNTSCVGGPNRKPFSILITLKLRELEIGRQVIDVKCCEGPLRDLANDEKREKMVTVTEKKDEVKKVEEIAYEVPNIKRKVTKKRKLADIKLEDTIDDSQEDEVIRVPKKYARKVKRYVNTLYIKDQVNKVNHSTISIKNFFTSESE